MAPITKGSKSNIANFNGREKSLERMAPKSVTNIKVSTMTATSIPTVAAASHQNSEDILNKFGTSQTAIAITRLIMPDIAPTASQFTWRRSRILSGFLSILLLCISLIVLPRHSARNEIIIATRPSPIAMVALILFIFCSSGRASWFSITNNMIPISANTCPTST